jgi:hypothetical protein
MQQQKLLVLEGYSYNFPAVSASSVVLFVVVCHIFKQRHVSDQYNKYGLAIFQWMCDREV